MKLFQALRRNPDVIALAVLCVVLGVGRQAMTARPALTLSNHTLGIHWACVKPATDALDSARTRLQKLVCDLPATLRLPDFLR